MKEDLAAETGENVVVVADGKITTNSTNLLLTVHRIHTCLALLCFFFFSADRTLPATAPHLSSTHHQHSKLVSVLLLLLSNAKQTFYTSGDISHGIYHLITVTTTKLIKHSTGTDALHHNDAANVERVTSLQADKKQCFFIAS